ncbi:non-ribosomal peptide synthetase [Streptomyces cinnamoneus]|uniref:non-ribosomal peptide synthetase n=1 Tax=Streptomyces cinnamoneus TaxID=53446 RepID=UPI00167D8643|nr:non-ribosomal peptide synthetase [Streptomyces cinnamoneus]
MDAVRHTSTPDSPADHARELPETTRTARSGTSGIGAPFREDPEEREEFRDELPDEFRDGFRAPASSAADGPAGGDPGTLSGLVTAQATATPGAVAVVHDGKSLSYAQLEQRSTRLAHELRARGVGSQTPVAVMLERDPELVVALLAVLKAGGAFVPVDPSYPAARVRHMLDDSGAGVVLVRGALRDRVPGGDGQGPWVIEVDGSESSFAHHPLTPPAPAPRPEHLAYVVYTSGSTGLPKGVMVEHRGIVSYLRGMLHHFPMGPGDRMLQATSLSFDVSVYEIFLPLLSGGATVLPLSGSHTDARHLSELIEEQQVTSLHMVPSLLRAFADGLDPRRCAGLRRIFVSGEALDPALVEAVHRRLPCELVNLYGATEVSVDSTWWAAPRDLADGPVLVGRPMAGATCHVLDERMRPVPAGAEGEVFLGGASVTRGYHGRAALTAERFVPDPFGPPGSRLYRTGDLGRLVDDGDLLLLGRIDHQVKLHGRRIEPGEIEAAMNAFAEVGNAAVVVTGEGEQAALTGFFTGERAEPGALRDFLARRLPAPLVPARLQRIAALPLSPNGKIDRTALAGLAVPPPPAADEPGPRAAGDPVLRTVLEAMTDVLGGTRIGPDDNFFARGGNSLHATRLVAKLRSAFDPGLGVRLVFEHQTPALLAAALRGPGPEDTASVSSDVPEGELSAAQHRMWLLAQMTDSPAEYAITLALHLTGELDAEAMAWAMDAVVARHDSLRSCFPERDGTPVRAEVPAAALRLRPAPPEPDGDVDRVLERVAREEIAGLDLAAGPLFRPVLVPLTAGGPAVPPAHLLVVVLHHIVADGWSTELILSDLATHYGARTAGREAPEPPRVGYERYLEIERRNEREGVTDRHLAHFTTALRGAPEEVTLPLDRPRPAQRTGRGATLRLDLGPEAADAVRRLAARHRTTPFVILLAGLSALLHRSGGHRDTVIGSAVAGRFDAEVDDLVGLCLNSVALRWQVGPGTPFTTVVERAAESLLGAMEHSAAPFARVVEKLGVPRDARRTPVFQVIALYDDFPDIPAFPGLTARPLETDDGSAQSDALFTFRPPGEEGLPVSVEFSTDVFAAESVRRWTGQLATLLSAAAQAPGTAVGELPLLPAGQRREVLQLGTGPARPLPADGTVTGLFARQARLTPHRTAVTSGAGGDSLSYAELDERSSRLAHALRKRGVGANTPVVVCLRRSTEVLTAVLGVLKAGGGYVPVEPDNPPGRIARLIADSGARLVVTQRALADSLADAAPALFLVDGPDASRELPTTAPGPLPRPCDLAYVIYTSGSTGRPKGVMVEHHSVVNYLARLQEAFALTGEDRLLLKSPLSFDVSVREVFWALCTGATLVVAEPGRHADPDHLVEVIERERVTVVHFVPSMLHVLLETLEGPGRCPSLRQVMTSGETLPVETARRCLELLGAELRNMYGPTETTVEMTDFDCRGRTGTDRLPIGRPFPNTRVYVLDEALRAVPWGVTGELYVSGDPVARGYLGRPALTAERFLPDPYGPPGARMYRTGDLGRFTAEGLLDFQGRSDFQVQLRGHRIELGEIEGVLCEQPGVSAAVAVVRRAESPEAAHLVAYAVTDAGPHGVDAGLREALAGRLPGYMVPASVVTLAALPLTVNGKLDRAALPDPASAGPARETERPHEGAGAGLDGRTERVLAGIWRELLGVAEVGPDDNFFALGGHSLLVATLSARVRSELGVRVPLTLFLRHPVLRDLAAALPDGVPAQGPAGGDGLRPRGLDRAPLSAAQRRVWVDEQLWPGTAAYTVPEAFRLRGPLDERAFEAALEELLLRHGALRTRVVGGEHPELVVAAEPVGLRRADVRGADEAGVRELLGAAARRVFDLDGPLVETVLARVADEEWLFLFTAHHLVVDGWSFDVLWRDLGALYRLHATGEGGRPELPGLSFTDYTCWESERVAAGAYRPHLDFWRQELAGLPEAPAVAGAGDTRRGESRAVPLGAELSARLRDVAAALGVSPFVLTLTAFALAVTAEGPAEQLIGVELAGRDDQRVAELVGLFINHVPLRVRRHHGGTARQAVASVGAAWRRVLDHAQVSFDAIVDELGGRRSHGKALAADVAFSYLDTRTPLHLEGVEVTPVEPGFNGSAKFGLLLEVFDTPQGLVGVFEHQPQRFDRARTTRIRNRWEAVLLGLLADPDLPPDLGD